MGTSIDYMQKEVEKTVRKMVKEEQKNPKHVPREKTDQNCGWLAAVCTMCIAHRVCQKPSK